MLLCLLWFSCLWQAGFLWAIKACLAWLLCIYAPMDLWMNLWILCSHA